MGGSAYFLQWIPVLALGVGILLIALGIRGRQVHSRPTCRRCRFDLSGTVGGKAQELAGGEGAREGVERRCPECGSLLAEAGAVREGTRRARPRVIAAGLVLVLVGVVGIGAIVVNRSAALVKYLPTWYLASQTNGPQDFIAQRAIVELNVRAGLGTLSNARAAALVQRALAVQGDKNATWLSEWGDLIGTLRNKGQVSDAQFATFIRQGVDVSLETRAIARAGEPLPVRSYVRPVRMANQGAGTTAYVRYEISSARTPEVTLDCQTGSFISGVGSMGGISSGVASFPLTAPVGETQLTLVLSLKADTSVSFATPLGSWERSFTVPIKVVPAGTPLVEVIDDASLAAAMQTAIRVKDVNIQTSGLAEEEHGTTYTINFDLKALPQNVAFEIFLRRVTAEGAAGGEEGVRVGSIVWMQGETGGWGTSNGARGIESRAGDMFDLILRPSVKVAEGDARLTRFWSGELVYRNVKVTNKRVGAEGEKRLEKTGGRR